MPEEVQHLVEAAARGDSRAVEELLERYLSGLRAFVRLRAGPLVRARESSSDLVQSTCREVLEHADRFRFPNEGAFKSWLFTTALRKIQNRHEFYRAQKRDVMREAGQDADPDAGGILSHYASFSTPSRHAILKEEMERVERAFEELTDEQREVVTLAHLVGLSRAEIAEQMGKSEGAVRVLLHRSLAKLAGLLDAGADD